MYGATVAGPLATTTAPYLEPVVLMRQWCRGGCLQYVQAASPPPQLLQLVLWQVEIRASGHRCAAHRKFAKPLHAGCRGCCLLHLLAAPQPLQFLL